jgi:multiple sugar transport system ATP-binding protein
VGELGLTTGDRVRLSPDPARIHRFDADGRAIRT